MTTSQDNALNELLQELLAEPRHQTVARVAGEVDRIAGPFAGRVVVFGSGILGKRALVGLRGTGVEPLAFCDNNPLTWDTTLEGVPIVSPAIVTERYKDSAAFIVAIHNPSKPTQQLRQLGCTRIIPYPVLFWKCVGSMSCEDRLELPYRILERAGEMAPAYELLADEVSRQEFRAQIRWRCLLDYDCLPAPHDAGEMYFPDELLSLSPSEVLVDCGAFDGDSIRSFLRKTNGSFRHIYAFEPDSGNRRALDSFIEQLPTGAASNVTVLPYVLGRQNGMIGFSAEGFVGSRVANSPASEIVECRSLDTVLADAPEPPTFIKMDIEGAEPDAIIGAQETISRYRPALAICAYHRCEHLWELPKLLNKANPDYRIYLRRYAEECWETVYYAIPR